MTSSTGKLGTNMPFISISIFNPIEDDLSATGLFTLRCVNMYLENKKVLLIIIKFYKS